MFVNEILPGMIIAYIVSWLFLALIIGGGEGFGLGEFSDLLHEELGLPPRLVFAYIVLVFLCSPLALLLLIIAWIVLTIAESFLAMREQIEPKKDRKKRQSESQTKLDSIRECEQRSRDHGW